MYNIVLELFRLLSFLYFLYLRSYMFIVCTFLPQKIPCLCELTWRIKLILIQIQEAPWHSSSHCLLWKAHTGGRVRFNQSWRVHTEAWALWRPGCMEVGVDIMERWEWNYLFQESLSDLKEPTEHQHPLTASPGFTTLEVKACLLRRHQTDGLDCINASEEWAG